MPQNWIIFTIASGLFSVAFNYVNRRVLRKDSDSTAYSWWFEFFRLLIFLPFFLFSLNFEWSSFKLFLFVAIGISEFFSVYYFMKMHSSSELSISSTVTQLRLVWIPIFAMIFFSERLKGFEYLGIALIILGQVTIAIRKGATLDNGVKYAFISSIFAGVNNITFKAASGVFNPSIVMVAMTLPTLFIFPLRMKDSRKRIISLGKKIWKKMFLATIFNAFSMYLLVRALEMGEVSKVSGVFQSMTALQVLVGILFLNEKNNIVSKIVGILIVMTGMLLLISF